MKSHTIITGYPDAKAVLKDINMLFDKFKKHYGRNPKVSLVYSSVFNQHNIAVHHNSTKEEMDEIRYFHSLVS